ncbi:4'-phosphopantetheinyl transferase family protein [Variovorax sp. PAMC 28711]|uniref:4'-phosphopantetheinyl transferase family protein n=1 Tax=Variovorax sp. PAMC 28711 TaxID=1795631 RepID=UPI000ACFC946|nr:4'-phosphopantetheinyl transferase superfamily protein [Variovorax sp. PAMC 28711]
MGCTAWLVHLDQDAALQWRDSLDETERTRAARFVFDRDRARYEAAHGATRYLLGLHLGRPSSELQFDIGALGKPHLAGSTAVHFNLSHSHHLGLLAIGDRPIGVDLEVLRPLDGLSDLAAAHFTDAERAALEREAPDDRLRSFLTGWTRKEACVKALGLGLAVDTRTVPTGLKAAPQAFVRFGGADAATVSLQSLYVGPSAIASIALLEFSDRTP